MPKKQEPELGAAQEPTLDQLRMEAGLTQHQLAEQSGVSWATVAKLETGEHKPSPATLDKLAAVLGDAVRSAKYGWRKVYVKRGRPRTKDTIIEEAARMWREERAADYREEMAERYNEELAEQYKDERADSYDEELAETYNQEREEQDADERAEGFREEMEESRRDELREETKGGE